MYDQSGSLEMRRDDRALSLPVLNNNAGAPSSTVGHAAGRKRSRRNHNKEIDDINDQLNVLMTRDEDMQQTFASLRVNSSVARSLLSSFQAVRAAHEIEGDCSKERNACDCVRSAFLIRIRKCPSTPKRLVGDEPSCVAITTGCFREAFVEFLRVAALQQENALALSSWSTCVSLVGSAVDLFPHSGRPRS
eukprot:TRINITY_DN7317_c0_g1_i1.p1 TRINITY_DN7317_c0_g1~~TRINITY_DN7317_c0_g1_i1.p1  ORF type:complete len:191 (+),score=26.90 TRINITY_DN7317_c0_g1_i1:711-1283(+)